MRNRSHSRISSPRHVALRQTRSPRRGWSLIELVVVVTILGIVASLASLKFLDSLGFRRVQSAAERLMHDINATQKQARLCGTTTSIDFDAVNHVYALHGVQNMDRPSLTDQIVSLRDDLLSTYFEQIELDDHANSISYNSYGVPDRGGTIIMRSGNWTRQILIDEKSGKAEIVP
jgi:prepilin-type N-terminal cleavage/methylation domain-containing protein